MFNYIYLNIKLIVTRDSIYSVKMKSVLVTGCNRGLGLGFVKHLLKSNSAPANLFATCRDINKATVSLLNCQLFNSTNYSSKN